MGLKLPVAFFGVLLSQQALSPEASSAASRTDFRSAVDSYQMFVVAHCAPEDVDAYVSARSARDQAFVSSLRGTKLYADYKRAVAARAKQDRNTVYECMGPPPPPPPPGTAPSPIADPTRVARERAQSLREHFEGGDRQFAILVQLRDAFIGATRRP